MSVGFKRSNSMEKAGKFVAQGGAVLTFCVVILESERESVFIRNIRRTIFLKSFLVWKIDR